NVKRNFYNPKLTISNTINGKFARNLIRFLEGEADKIDDEQGGLKITEPFRKLTFQKVSYSYYMERMNTGINLGWYYNFLAESA
ncbi:MAG TPA: hypothetical protein DEG06_11410, partial [Lachnospiraceae bacterium]|nr:hypothetical protein [Lachnospiraceae bacterium]